MEPVWCVPDDLRNGEVRVDFGCGAFNLTIKDGQITHIEIASPSKHLPFPSRALAAEWSIAALADNV
jgi:hypothetical protein